MVNFSVIGYDVSDGYRYYDVTDRSRTAPAGGLCLPLPPYFSNARGRLMLGAVDNFVEVQMTSSSGGNVGNASSGGLAGIFTKAISGCQAVGIFTYENGHWTKYFFQHCMAGYHNLGKAAQQIINPNDSFAIIAQIGMSGLDATADHIVATVGVPKIQITGYNAGSSAGMISFGVRIYGGAFGEI